MKKFAVSVLAGITLASIPVAAYATDTPQEKPAYHLVLWNVPGGEGSVFDPDQRLVTSVVTDEADLSLLDSSMLCGHTYQVDLYWNSEVTDALVAGGVLHDAGNPAEDLAYGAVEGNPWKVLTTPDCVKPDDEITEDGSEVLDCGKSQWVITSGYTTITYVGDRTGYTASEPVRTENPTTYRPATIQDCPPSLALTGVNDEQARNILFVGGGLLLAGVVVFFLYLRGRKVGAHRA